MVDPSFLLDTNICIYLLEGLSPMARDQMQARQPGEVVTSAIVYAEVMRGIDQSNAQAVMDIERFFEIVPVLPFERRAGATFAEVPFRRGRFDRLIAAHALALDLTVVTGNEADFAHVPGLRVENWTLPPA